MAHHDDHLSQPDDQGSSMPHAWSVEPTNEPEEQRPPDQDRDEQAAQGLVSVQASAQVSSDQQEGEGPQQGLLDTPPQEALEQGDPLLEDQALELSSTSPAEPLERAAVTVTAQQESGGDEQPLPQPDR